MTEEFDRDNVLVGWMGTTRRHDGKSVPVFIPRRDEDIAADRQAIRSLFRRINR